MFGFDLALFYTQHPEMQTFVIVSNNVCISLGILPSCEQLAAHTACVRGGFGSVSLTPLCWPPLFCHFAMPQPGCWGQRLSLVALSEELGPFYFFVSFTMQLTQRNSLFQTQT